MNKGMVLFKECLDRTNNVYGKAIVLFETLIREQANQEVYLWILKHKFNGDIKKMLIWLYGEDFKDVDIDFEEELKKKHLREKGVE